MVSDDRRAHAGPGGDQAPRGTPACRRAMVSVDSRRPSPWGSPRTRPCTPVAGRARESRRRLWRSRGPRARAFRSSFPGSFRFDTHTDALCPGTLAPAGADHRFQTASPSRARLRARPAPSSSPAPDGAASSASVADAPVVSGREAKRPQFRAQPVVRLPRPPGAQVSRGAAADCRFLLPAAVAPEPVAKFASDSAPLPVQPTTSTTSSNRAPVLVATARARLGPARIAGGWSSPAIPQLLDQLTPPRLLRRHRSGSDNPWAIDLRPQPSRSRRRRRHRGAPSPSLLAFAYAASVADRCGTLCRAGFNFARAGAKLSSRGCSKRRIQTCAPGRQASPRSRVRGGHDPFPHGLRHAPASDKGAMAIAAVITPTITPTVAALSQSGAAPGPRVRRRSRRLLWGG